MKSDVKRICPLEMCHSVPIYNAQTGKSRLVYQQLEKNQIYSVIHAAGTIYL